MIVVMEEGASDEQISRVLDRLIRLGFDIHRSTGERYTVLGAVGGQIANPRELLLLDGVREVVKISVPYKAVARTVKPTNTVIKIKDITIGAGAITLFAGPGVVENEDQLNTVAELMVAQGVRVLRTNTFIPPTPTYADQEVKIDSKQLKLLRQVADRYAFTVVSEVTTGSQVPLVSEYVDIIQVGAVNMRNFSLLKELGKVKNPILLEHDKAATADELLLSAEFIINNGNEQVILCERGIRTFETARENTLDLAAVLTLKRLSHLPIIVAPGYAVARRDQISAMARAAVATDGLDGLILELHPDPDQALCCGAQSLYPDQFAKLMIQLRQIANAIERSIT